MKIGLLAFSTNTGLGYQTYNFYKYMKPEKVLIADIYQYNAVPTHHDRFKGNVKVSIGIPSNEAVEWLVNEMDVVFVCETPLNWNMFNYAHSKGVKIVLQHNYELLEYFRNPYLPYPTVFASPTQWGMKEVAEISTTPVEQWQVPIDLKRYKYRRIKEGNTFIHITGRPAAYDRNGTIPFLEAAMSLGTKYQYNLYIQPPTEGNALKHFQPISDKIKAAKVYLEDSLQVFENVEDNKEMYKNGEVLVLPRRYGGLCLPMLEALATGIPVIMPNTSPNQFYLPEDWLADARQVGDFTAFTHIPIFETIGDSLKNTMKEVMERVGDANFEAYEIAKKYSWEKYQNLYNLWFTRICE